MKPSFLNRFMKKLTREWVVPTIFCKSPLTQSGDRKGINKAELKLFA